MSGCGNGVCTALAISNAITNLCGKLFERVYGYFGIIDQFTFLQYALAFILMVIALSLLNFAATLFGQLWRLEPLAPEKKAMWRREMEWFLCVSDHVVELMPSWQTFPDGSKLEV
jgi:hypothetical protein